MILLLTSLACSGGRPPPPIAQPPVLPIPALPPPAACAPDAGPPPPALPFTAWDLPDLALAPGYHEFQADRPDGTRGELPDMSWGLDAFPDAKGGLPLEGGVLACITRYPDTPEGGQVRLRVEAGGNHVFSSFKTRDTILFAAAPAIDLRPGDPLRLSLLREPGGVVLAEVSGRADALPVSLKGEGMTAQCRTWSPADLQERIDKERERFLGLIGWALCETDRSSLRLGPRSHEFVFERDIGILESLVGPGGSEVRALQERVDRITRAHEEAAKPVFAAIHDALPPVGVPLVIVPGVITGALRSATCKIEADFEVCDVVTSFTAETDLAFTQRDHLTLPDNRPVFDWIGYLWWGDGNALGAVSLGWALDGTPLTDEAAAVPRGSIVDVRWVVNTPRSGLFKNQPLPSSFSSGPVFFDLNGADHTTAARFRIDP